MTKSSEITELLKKGMKQKDIAEKLNVSKPLVSRLNSKLKSESESKDSQIELTQVNQVNKKLTNLTHLNPETKNNGHNPGSQVNPVNQELTKGLVNSDPGKSWNQGSLKKIQIKDEIRHLVNLLGISSKFYKKEGFKGTLEIRERISSLLDQL